MFCLHQVKYIFIFIEDSEAEDDIIKPSDNLILVGHVEDDSASLEVYSKLKNNLNFISHVFILIYF